MLKSNVNIAVIVQVVGMILPPVISNFTLLVCVHGLTHLRYISVIIIIKILPFIVMKYTNPIQQFLKTILRENMEAIVFFSWGEGV